LFFQRTSKSDNKGSKKKLLQRKKASVGAAHQVFVVVAKYPGTAPTAFASSGKLSARTVTQIKVLVCLNNCISLGFFLYEI
jgi:hypothetical protein